MEHCRIDYNTLLDIEEAKEAAWMAKLPICHECGEPIQHEHLYRINDCFVCPYCLEDNYRGYTADYVED